MAESLLGNYEKLIEIRRYLIKKGQGRYGSSVTLVKLQEAEKLFKDSEILFSTVSGSKDQSEIELVTETFSKISSLFTEILILCKTPERKLDTKAVEQKSDKMEFDLKTACGLIPVLDDKENTTKRLIDAVEMYADMLNSAGQLLLIKFVLKGRLSENAKLRVNTDYPTVKDMLQDLKKKLLTTKSFTAIQGQIQSLNQGFRSIDEYGSQLEKLLTELNISQADGDASKIDVLKPINEKMAVKKFADGLKDEKVSTIITARNYSSLKDAIQAAKDESKSSTSRQAEVMKMTPARGKYYNNRTYFRGQARGQFPRAQGHFANNSNRGRFQDNRNDYRNNAPRYQGRSRSFYYNSRGRGQYQRRGYARRGGQGSYTNNNLFTIPPNVNAQMNASENYSEQGRDERANQFFRDE